MPMRDIYREVRIAYTREKVVPHDRTWYTIGIVVAVNKYLLFIFYRGLYAARHPLHIPEKKGVPKGWRLPIRDILLYSGAKFLCPCAGAISLMPGTASDPSFRHLDVDVKTGKVSGLS